MRRTCFNGNANLAASNAVRLQEKSNRNRARIPSHCWQLVEFRVNKAK